MIIDDFTNSGGTLFGAVKLFDGAFFLSRKLRLVKMYAGNAGSDEINVSIFVSHLVATYDPKAAASMTCPSHLNRCQTVDGLKEKLHELGKQCRNLAEFVFFQFWNVSYYFLISHRILHYELHPKHYRHAQG